MRRTILTSAQREQRRLARIDHVSKTVWQLQSFLERYPAIPKEHRQFTNPDLALRLIRQHWHGDLELGSEVRHLDYPGPTLIVVSATSTLKPYKPEPNEEYLRYTESSCLLKIVVKPKEGGAPRYVPAGKLRKL